MEGAGIKDIFPFTIQVRLSSPLVPVLLLTAVNSRRPGIVCCAEEPLATCLPGLSEAPNSKPM